MDDPHLSEPLLAEAEGLANADFPMLDEELLDQLRSLDAAEAGTAVDDHAVQDEDVYKMRELIREKPKDVIQYLEEEGVAKLGEFEVQDAVAFKAFGKESIMTIGADHYEVDWETMWREQLSEYSRNAAGMGWTTKITMEAHVVNLRDAAAEGSKGLLHPLLKRYHARGCSAAVFALPAVQAVIHFKWTTWARRFLLYELGCYLAWLACYTAFTLLFQQEDWTMTFWELMRDRNGFLATVFSVVTLAPMAPFWYMELCTIAAYGVGWVGAWNIMDMVSYVLQVVICVLHLQREFVDEGWFSVLVATQHVLLWTKLHYFAKAFNPTKTTLVDTVSRILEDLKWFLVFLALTMIGFGLAFYSLYRQDRDKFPDFANIWHSFASMYSYLLAMFDYNVFYSSTNPTAAMLLFCIFEFMFNVLLLNVLIASMTNSYSKISQDEGLRFLTSKAEIIDELETTLPKWVRSKKWYPTFVHILKFHPDSTYEVNLNSVWSGMGLMENNLLGAQQETRLRVEELEDRLGKLHKKLDVLIKLFISSMSPSHSLGGLSREPTVVQGAAAAAHGLHPVYSGQAPGPISPHTHSFTSAGCNRTDAQPSSGMYGGFGSAAAPAAPAAQMPGTTTPRAQLRHALSQLPEALTSVSGPIGPGLGYHHVMGYPYHPSDAGLGLGYMYGYPPGVLFGHPFAGSGFGGPFPVRRTPPLHTPGAGKARHRSPESQADDTPAVAGAGSGNLERTASGGAAVIAATAGDVAGSSPFNQQLCRGQSRRASCERSHRASIAEDHAAGSQRQCHRTATMGHMGAGMHNTQWAPPASAAVHQQLQHPAGWSMAAAAAPLPYLRAAAHLPVRQLGRGYGADQEGRRFLRQCMLARSHSL